MALGLYNGFRGGGTVSGGSSDIYGRRIGPIGMPNPAGDLAAQYPNLTGTNATLSNDIMSKLSGELSPGTIAAINNAAATYGVQNGMPGTSRIYGTLSGNLGLRDIGRSAEDQIESGIKDYNMTLPTISGTQTVKPETQAEISATNATNAAAPDPTAAATHAQQLFDQYLERLRSMNAPAQTNPLFSALGGKPWWAPSNATEFIVPAAAGGVRGNSALGSYY